MWYNEKLTYKIEQFDEKTEALKLKVKEESRKIKGYSLFVKKRSEHKELFMYHKNDMSDVLTDLTLNYLFKIIVVSLFLGVAYNLSSIAQGMQYIVYLLALYLLFDDTKEWLKNSYKIIKIRKKLKEQFINKINKEAKTNSLEILKTMRMDENEKNLLLNFYKKEKLTKWDENYFNSILYQN